MSITCKIVPHTVTYVYCIEAGFGRGTARNQRRTILEQPFVTGVGTKRLPAGLVGVRSTG